MYDKNTSIGFVGMGWIGKHLFLSFQERGFTNLVPYSLEEPYNKNKNALNSCELVFIAVPTPTTPEGFDDSILDAVIPLTAINATVVIKSTILPTTARKLQEKYRERIIMHNIEFLTEATAKADTDYPERNVVGIEDLKDDRLVKRAQEIIDILPQAHFDLICTYEEASLIKYAGNCFFYTKLMYFNILYNLSQRFGCNWKKIRQAIIADSRIHPVHTQPVHKGGRGGGSHCLIKDYAAFSRMYREMFDDDPVGRELLHWNEEMNKKLLTESNKDLDILRGVYGK